MMIFMLNFMMKKEAEKNRQEWNKGRRKGEKKPYIFGYVLLCSFISRYRKFTLEFILHPHHHDHHQWLVG